MRLEINGSFVLIDDEDAALVLGIKWYLHKAKQRAERYYAVSGISGKTVYMHRLIMACPPGMTVDHVNGDGLDNRRSNLRLATRSQNNANMTASSKVGYRGVERKYNKFRAHISAPPSVRDRSKKIHLGSFVTAEDAARAYDRAALKRFGEFARLNFPNPHNTAGE